jgi:hypothetical protein
MTDAEREIMERHAAYWRPLIEVVTTGTGRTDMGKMLAGFVRSTLTGPTC